jgi:hypothetical protein
MDSLGGYILLPKARNVGIGGALFNAVSVTDFPGDAFPG